MNLELNGKKAIITGGSRGIGKAIAMALSSEGVICTLIARNKTTLEVSAKDISKLTKNPVYGVVADTGLDESVRNVVSEANILMDGIDILVNCAARPLAIKKIHNFGDLTTESFDREMNVKVMGYIRCAREVAPIMKRRGWGRIINISGLASRSTGNVVGSMRNVAVSALTKNLADELGPFGINVIVIHPGFTRTEATESFIIERASELGKEPKEVEVELAKNNSVNRVIESTDIAYVATMIASPKSIAINGDVIAAGGGVGSSIYY